MSRHGYDDQESTYRFIQKLRGQPELLEQFGADLKELAKQAREDYPASGPLVDEIEAVADLINGSVDEARGWHPMARAAQRRDVQRVEEPRKSPRVEATADVGRAIRDM